MFPEFWRPGVVVIMPPLHSVFVTSSIGVGRKFDPCGRHLNFLLGGFFWSLKCWRRLEFFLDMGQCCSVRNH